MDCPHLDAGAKAQPGGAMVMQPHTNICVQEWALTIAFAFETQEMLTETTLTCLSQAASQPGFNEALKAELERLGYKDVLSPSIGTLLVTN